MGVAGYEKGWSWINAGDRNSLEQKAYPDGLPEYRRIGDGVFGVEAAAQRYFHKPASKLTRSEAALLAAVLPNPLRFKVSSPSGYVRSRQAWILRQMYQLGGEPFMQQHQLD